MIAQIIGSLGGLASTYLDSRDGVEKAEAETQMKIAKGAVGWELEALQAAARS